MRPFLLQHRHKDEVEFVDKCFFGLEGLLRARALQDVLDDEVADTWTVLEPVSHCRSEGRYQP